MGINKKTIIQVFAVCMLFFSCWSCQSSLSKKETDYTKQSWKEIEKEANGQTVNLLMWQGDTYINKYMKEYVTPLLKSKFNINLEIAPSQGNQIVAVLMAEEDAHTEYSNIDMCWINGETFYQLRQINALYGPFVNGLPNAEYINFNSPFIQYDFQKPVEGMECPWGNVQMCLIYNSNKISSPPANRTSLEAFVKANPGKFTFTTDFTGLTFLKCLLIDMAGGKDTLGGAFDEDKYKKYSALLWEYINRIKPYFWKEGKTFPNAVAAMHQMFANGELYITMSNNDGEVDNKVAQGIFPSFAKAYVLDAGTIQNSHYMGIIKNASHKAASLVVANFLISPQAQLEKQKPGVWGDGTVLNTDKLPAFLRQQFDSLQNARKYGPKRDLIQSKSLMEPAPEYMIRLNDDLRKYVIEQ